MAHPPVDPTTYFHSQVPDAPLRHIVKAIHLGHDTAWRYCQDNFPDHVRHDAIATIRRAHVETNVASVLKRYPDITVVSTANKKNNAYHNVITSGEVVMTVSAVPSVGDFPPEAAFRQEYAGQYAFDLFGPTVVPTNGRLFAVIIHGPPPFPETKEARALSRFDRAAFVQVGFPDKDFARWQCDCVDLLRRFGDDLGEGDAGSSTPRVPLRPVLLPSDA